MKIVENGRSCPTNNGSFGCSKGESAGNHQFVRLSHQNIEGALQILQLWEFDRILMNLVVPLSITKLQVDCCEKKNRSRSSKQLLCLRHVLETIHQTFR